MFRAILLIGKAKEAFNYLNILAKEYPTRTIGEITEDIKMHLAKHNKEVNND